MTQSYTVSNKSSDTTQNGATEAGVRLLSSSSSNSNLEGITERIYVTTSSGSTVEMRKDISQKEQLEKIEIEADEQKKRCVHWTKIIWSFISFWISVADVTVIIYLSYLHFHHSSDIIAWLMLLPILLNFIGIFTFLSDDDERREMESLGCHNVVWKNLMFFPVLGPSVSALKLFVLSFQEENAERFERLESLLTRMKQYESFFRAAPEAFVQLTFRIITWSRTKEFHAEDYWVNVCLSLCLFALAESNMYSTIIPYYRLFTRIRTKDAWSIEHIRIPWRVALFFFNFLSIESRLYADAILKSTACFYFHEHSFGEVLIVTFLCQFVARAALYSFFIGVLGSKRQRKVLNELGVYGVFTFAWRSLFMSFSFQSYCPTIFLSFYVENLILIISSYVIILTRTDVDLRDKYMFNVYAAVSVLAMICAIGLRCLIKKRFEMGISRENKIHIKE